MNKAMSAMLVHLDGLRDKDPGGGWFLPLCERDAKAAARLVELELAESQTRPGSCPVCDHPGERFARTFYRLHWGPAEDSEYSYAGSQAEKARAGEPMD